MPLQSVLGLGGGLSNTSVTSKTEQTIESFAVSFSGNYTSFTTPAPVDSGGTEYTVITWVTPGSFTVNAGSRNVDIFVMGGGGSGGYSSPTFISNGNGYPNDDGVFLAGQGGGGGGYNQYIDVPLPVKTYPVTVGAGGENGADGGDTNFFDAPIGGIGAFGGQAGSRGPKKGLGGLAEDGTCIINGNRVKSIRQPGQNGNTYIATKPWPPPPNNHYYLLDNFDPVPSSIPQTELEQDYGYVVGGSGGSVSYIPSAGPPTNLQPGTGRAVAPNASSLYIGLYSPDTGMDAVPGMPAPGVVFGGFPGLSGGSYPGGGTWGSGGGGGANAPGSASTKRGRGGSGGGDGGGSGPGGNSFSGKNATSIGSGGGGQGIQKSFSLTNNTQGDGGGAGDGMPGICIVRYISKFY